MRVYTHLSCYSNTGDQIAQTERNSGKVTFMVTQKEKQKQMKSSQPGYE